MAGRAWRLPLLTTAAGVVFCAVVGAICALKCFAAKAIGRVAAPRPALDDCRRCWRQPRTPSGLLRGALPELAGGAEVAAGMVFFGAGAWWIAGALERQKRSEQFQSVKGAEATAAATRARVQPRAQPWTLDELAQYDGKNDPEGPILIAVDGIVLNVWKGRHFYLPGCEYHIFAGRDATRLLARGLLEEEPLDEAAQPLTLAEQAALQSWLWTLKSKYEVVGTLEGG